jgi:phage tail-like protein
MADNGSAQGTTWPLPKFYFSVTFSNGVTASFQEVTGLETETKIIEYRHGDNSVFSPIKMPGLARVGNVTMRKGIFAGDTTFWTWYDQIVMNTIARTTVVVNLLDQTGAPKYTWTLNMAWPTKLTGTDLKSEGNEVAIEGMEIAFETMVISGGG